MVRLNSPRHEAIRIERTLWYIAYRKWEYEVFQRFNGSELQQAIMNSREIPDGKAAERIVSRLALMKIPFDMAASAIERAYANDPDFDCERYHGRETSFPNDDGIEKGIKALRERRDDLCELLGMSKEELFHAAGLANGDDLPAIPTVDEHFEKARLMTDEGEEEWKAQIARPRQGH